MNQVRMRRHAFHWLACVLLAAGLSTQATGCGASGSQRVSDPWADAIGRASQTLGRAAVQGTRASQAQETVRFQLRYNPASCDCPPWEILMYGRWTRILISSQPGHEAQLDHLLEQAERDLGDEATATYQVMGRIGEDTWRSEQTGLDYQTLLLVGANGEEIPDYR